MSEPVAKSFLMCNFTVQDKQNRWTLAAIFNRMWIGSLPWKLPAFTVFAQVADMPLSGTLMIQVESPNGLVVWTGEAMMFERAGDSFSTFEGIFTVNPFVIQSMGRYRVALYINQSFIVDTVLIVAPAEEKVPS